MKRLALTNFSLRFPLLILAVVVGATVFFGSQFPKVHFDNDPENMLSENEAVRIFHHEIKDKFSLYDFVIVGIVNETHPDGVFNVDTLKKIDTLTHQLLSLRQGVDGRPEVVSASGSRDYQSFDLRPTDGWSSALNIAFRHDPNDLFLKDGTSAIITREIIAPSVVDNIKQAGFGSLKIAYLMEELPHTRDEALSIRDDAMSNPLYKGTLVSEDEKAICLYIPIAAKTYSYNVANLVRELTKDWGSADQVYITGLPVAEDTFGVEMLVQMATSAPLAGLAIFFLLLLFFRRVSLIIAPMLVAVISIVCTMGLLIGLGFDVHIMSSMIAIFLMPIAVADAVHILSEFFDVYHKFQDKKKALRNVISHLFMPMLYTSLTTIAGFASLATTPIPPVRVFGLHVAFGVGLAWILTMAFVPAYILLFVSKRTLHKLCQRSGSSKVSEVRNGLLSRFLGALGGVSYRYARVIIAVAVAVLVFSICGLTKIHVNDNPVKWFTPTHPIRVADRVLNDHFGGTYTAYLTLMADPNATMTSGDKSVIIRQEVKQRFGSVMPAEVDLFLKELSQLETISRNVEDSDPSLFFEKLLAVAKGIDKKSLTSWNMLSEKINYLEDKNLLPQDFRKAIAGFKDVDPEDGKTLLGLMASAGDLSGEALREKALVICDSHTALSFESFVRDISTELTAPAFKRPDVLRYVEDLQRYLDGLNVVGKTSSSVDALKKASFELQYIAPLKDASPEDVLVVERKNHDNFSVPLTATAVGQVYIQLEGMKKKDTLFHLVTRDYKEANIWVQLTSGDNRDMQLVVDEVEHFVASHEPPVAMKVGWAGLTYLNVVWQDRMVRGMFSSLASSFIVVFIMMILLFRSPLYGVLAMIPLSLTILFIYGLIGWIGKDYDMPVAILSSMTLGLSVDFAIHFLQRASEERKRFGTWKDACVPMFREPAMAISRNAITISIGFTPLLLAPLVPYKTVGFFLATIMAVSWLATLLLLPALLTVLQRFIFKNNIDKEKGVHYE